MTVQVPITHEGVPRVKILAVVARDDGELVADLIEIQVSCQLEHEVTTIQHIMLHLLSNLGCTCVYYVAMVTTGFIFTSSNST